MADGKKLSDQDYLLAEVVVKVAAIERLLIKTGMITSDDIVKEMETISKEVISHLSSLNVNSEPEINLIGKIQVPSEKEKN